VIRRREAGWQEEVSEGREAILDLPEVQSAVTMGDLYPA
jgi:hypothetical protein